MTQQPGTKWLTAPLAPLGVAWGSSLGAALGGCKENRVGSQQTTATGGVEERDA